MHETLWLSLEMIRVSEWCTTQKGWNIVVVAKKCFISQNKKAGLECTCLNVFHTVRAEIHV